MSTLSTHCRGRRTLENVDYSGSYYWETTVTGLTLTDGVLLELPYASR